MTKPHLSPLDKITLEEALRIVVYTFGHNPKMQIAVIDDLIRCADEPHRAIAPCWYEDYKQHLLDNKNEK